MDMKSDIEYAEFRLSQILSAFEEQVNNNLEKVRARSIRELCVLFRSLGLLSFLDTGRREKLFARFNQSSALYLSYLKVASEDKKVATSEPFYDAICAGDWEVTKEIAQNSASEWNPDFEYEEDFLFFSFLMKFFFLEADKKELTGIIEEHEEAANGEDKEHRNILKAFLKKDELLFEKNIHALLQIRSDKMENKIAREAHSDEDLARRYFSLEGLALIKLADRLGFKTGKNYLHVPERLRKDPGFKFDPDCWLTPDYSPTKL